MTTTQTLRARRGDRWRGCGALMAVYGILLLGCVPFEQPPQSSPAPYRDYAASLTAPDHRQPPYSLLTRLLGVFDPVPPGWPHPNQALRWYWLLATVGACLTATRWLLWQRALAGHPVRRTGLVTTASGIAGALGALLLGAIHTQPASIALALAASAALLLGGAILWSWLRAHNPDSARLNIALVVGLAGLASCATLLGSVLRPAATGSLILAILLLTVATRQRSLLIAAAAVALLAVIWLSYPPPWTSPAGAELRFISEQQFERMKAAFPVHGALLPAITLLTASAVTLLWQQTQHRNGAHHD